MYKEYKCVRISYETKYWINQLMSYTESKLTEERTFLIQKYEEHLKQQEDFLHGYSPALLISVSHSSIIEAAYNYVKNINIDWQKKQTEMECIMNEMGCEEKISVGTLTPQLRLRQDTWDGLEKYRCNRQVIGPTNKAALNYVIQVIVFIYYQKIFDIS